MVGVDLIFVSIRFVKYRSTSNFCINNRWYAHKNKYPRLHQLACSVLSVPASSASVERVFSSAGYTVKNRPNLNPQTLDDLLVLKSNHDLKTNIPNESEIINE